MMYNSNDAKILAKKFNLKLTDKLIFEDTNNKLKDFDIINDSNAIDYEVKNNKLTIKPIEPNIINIILPALWFKS